MFSRSLTVRFCIMPPKLVRLSLGCLALTIAALANGQDTLTLDEALRMARLNNGDVRAATFDVRAANARVKQAKAAFFPTITPFAQYSNRRTVTDIGTGNQVVTDDGFTTGFDANWNILDAGQREFSLLGARRSEDAERLDARQ